MSVFASRSWVRALVAVAASLALGASLSVAAPAPSQAAARWNVVLCKGYVSCGAYGMTNHGYQAASGGMYWRMYAGHNCTNYVAYMMIKLGMSTTRPWSGTGNAYYWGTANKTRTNSTPTVGSVAWWSGGAGHVAYVEAVLSPTQIIISEDQWGGDFYWKLLTLEAGNWPTGFIHFKESKTGGVVPELRGREYTQTVYADATRSRVVDTARMRPGSTAWVELRFLNTAKASWTGLHLATASGAASGIDGGWASPTAIATQQEELVAPGESATFGFPIRIPTGLADATPVKQDFAAVTAEGLVVPSSTFHFAVTADSRSVFTSKPLPTITGVTTQANTLTAVPGAWGPGNPTFTYQWKRNGAVIPGATGAEYLLAAADAGRKVSVTVTASAPGYVSVTSTSASTPVIASMWPNSLYVGQSLPRGGQLVSLDGEYRVYQRADGALVLQNRFTLAVKWTNRVVSPTAFTRLNTTGSLSSYNGANQRLWTTGAKAGVYRACVTSTGQLQLRDANNKVIWTVG